jgi:cytoskeleton protein RodZ
MSDGLEHPIANDLVDSNASQHTSAGALLKASRQAAGLHIAALAVQLKVPVHRLEALEADQWDALPDMVFTRALASSVCRTLGVNSAPVLERLPANDSPTVGGSAVLKAIPVTPKKMKSLTAEPSRFSRWWILGLVVLTCLVASAFVLFKSETWSLQKVVPRIFTTSVSGASGDVRLDEKIPSSVDLMNHALDASLTSIQTPIADQDASINESSSPVSALPNAQPSYPSAQDVQSSHVDPVLLIKARGTTWVQVRNVSGKIVVERQLQSGDEIALSDDLPLSVVVGRSDLTDITFRGQPFDLTKVARENVARFEVR